MICGQYSQVLKPLEHLIGILVGLLARQGALHNSKAISLKVVTEVAEQSLLFGAAEEQFAHSALVTRCDGLSYTCHLKGCVNVSLCELCSQAQVERCCVSRMNEMLTCDCVSYRMVLEN
jgi:hypothetical protein